MKVDISVKALEKSIDLVKDFLDKLIMPSVEETGLLLKDKVTLWKFKNQIRMLRKCKDYCEKNEVSTKAISLKLLCPLLDNAALEEDEKLQDKWAMLLANMVDSDQNYQNHVFPHLLSQLSLSEFECLELSYKFKELTMRPVLTDLEYSSNRLRELRRKQKEEGTLVSDKELIDLEKNIELNKNLLNDLPNCKVKNLKKFEINNLFRLGLIKEVPFTSAVIDPKYLDDVEEGKLKKEDLMRLNVEVNTNTDYIVITDLGLSLMAACSDHRSSSI